MSLRPGSRGAKWIARPQSMVGPDQFRFLGEARDISGAAAWRDAATPLLWLYNLHYFDVLSSHAVTADPGYLASLMDRWIAENPPGAKPGWDPYPMSLRIVNWIKADLAGMALDTSMVTSLSIQVQWLRSRLEWHLLGNHIFANAKALWFAAHFFAGRGADELLGTALGILERELDEQVFADGFHFERSPMYHAIIQEDVLDMIAVAQARPIKPAAAMVERLRRTARRMARALPVMTHPDGGHAFFNDTALDISATCEELSAYTRQVLGDDGEEQAVRPPRSIRHLPDAGYLRADNGGATVIFDVAAVGPDYIPGHAHADTLSLEMSLGRDRVIVNGGTSCYGLSDERLRQRGTAAHSTVIVDGQNSSEVWSGFRVARRARPFALEIDEDGQACGASCAHDGYRRLPGRPIHRRRWRLEESRLTIDDRLDPAGNHEAIANYILHPDVRVMDQGGKGLRLVLPSGQAVRFEAIEGTLVVHPSVWAPRFGCNIATSCITVTLADGFASVALDW